MVKFITIAVALLTKTFAINERGASTQCVVAVDELWYGAHPEYSSMTQNNDSVHLHYICK